MVEAGVRGGVPGLDHGPVLGPCSCIIPVPAPQQLASDALVPMCRHGQGRQPSPPCQPGCPPAMSPIPICPHSQAISATGCSGILTEELFKWNGNA